MEEFINKVELLGIVGRSERQKIGDTHVDMFSVVTNDYYRDAKGTPTIDTTWFRVSHWGSTDPAPEKGQRVRLAGRFRCRKFVTPDKEERTTYDILASSVEIIKED